MQRLFIGIRYVARTMATWLRCCLHGLLAAALAGVLLLATVPARAQEVDPRETQAHSECLAGRYQAGVDLLAQLFAETGNADFIYNQGRCYQQNAKPDEAILQFRAFLRKAKDLSVEERAEVNRRIAECQTMKPKRDSGAPAATTAPPPPALPPAEVQPAPPAVPAPAAPEKPVTAAAPAGVAETTPAQPSASAGMRTGGVLVGSLGAAGIITGAIFSLTARSIANQVTADNAQHTYSRTKDNRGRVFGDLQWMGYTLGGALLATGGFLYYLGYREAHSPASDSLSFLPMLLPGGSGAVMQGSF